MRCDQCQFWEPPRADYDWDQTSRSMGRCIRIPHREDMTEWSDCDDGYSNRTIKPEYADRTAAACDASGYAAYIITKPEHFCAMFKGKSDAET